MCSRGMTKNASTSSYAPNPRRIVPGCSKTATADPAAGWVPRAELVSAEPAATAAINDGHGPVTPGVGGRALAAWAEPVLEALTLRWSGEGRTAERMLASARELLEEVAATGVEASEDAAHELVARWCWRSCAGAGSYRRARPSTARHRQSIARAVFNEAARLGVAVDPDALVGEPITRPPAKSVRALTVVETHRVLKWVATAPPGSRQPLVAALALAGGTATEIAKVCVGDIDLDNATVNFVGAAARVGILDAWGVRAVRRYLRDNSPIPCGVPLCVRERTTSEREVESVSGHLRRMLRTAGLYGCEGVSVDSIRLTAARRVLHTDGIAAAAVFLGMNSLDRAAAALGHNWRQPDG